MATIFDRKKAETVIPQLEKGASLVTKRLTKVSKAADDAATKATGFIKPTSSEGGQDDGVMIFPKAEESNPQNYVYIDTDSMDIYRDGNLVATFGGEKIEMYNDSGIPLFQVESGETSPSVTERNIKKKASTSSSVTITIPTKFSLYEFNSVVVKYKWGIATMGSPHGENSARLTPDAPTKTIQYNGTDIATIQLGNITENSFDINIATLLSDTEVEVYEETFTYKTTSPVLSKLTLGAFPSRVEDLLMVIGNGTGDDDKSNSFGVDWEGNGYFSGDIYAGCNEDSTNGYKVFSSKDAVIDETQIRPSETPYFYFSGSQYRNDINAFIGHKDGYFPVIYSVECATSSQISVVNWSLIEYEVPNSYSDNWGVNIHAINRSTSAVSGVRFAIKIMWFKKEFVVSDANEDSPTYSGSGEPTPSSPSGGGGNGINLPNGGEVGDMLVKGEIALEWEHKERLTNTEIENMINAMA